MGAPGSRPHARQSFGDFYAGVAHPVTALEHALPILAMGLLAGQQGERAARWLVLVFPLALLIGGLGSLPRRYGSPAMGLLNAASFVVLGLLLAAGWRLPLPVLIALGAVFGLSHGYENGRAWPTPPSTSSFWRRHGRRCGHGIGERGNHRPRRDGVVARRRAHRRQLDRRDRDHDDRAAVARFGLRAAGWLREVHPFFSPSSR